ncbi:hypothetical protein MUN89_18785 [Halobacillus salinarum]|uniref:Sugar phosphate isomerase/epimerase n=1 Tax=Halobacillus salinarum TaxID=2932257 RepID=A0ABY4EID3_9BACI|nr:hypothetical protein [Halobacillus salinarum]UOQ43894.1 hypothetical protein MUN89_18785 [Halobacillus salinarum]
MIIQFIINTVMLEKNRWTSHKTPSINISDWMGEFQKGGFSGVELWENHAREANQPENERLLENKSLIRILNSYAGFGDEQEIERRETVQLAREFEVEKVKFNLGDDFNRIEQYLKNIESLRVQLPQECKLLCECHPGTVMEDPVYAAKVLERLGSDQYEVIVHPFLPGTNLTRWFDYLGPLITHVHVSCYEDHRFHLLKERMELVKERSSILQAEGFDGTFSFEFTKGVAVEDEHLQKIYANALDDKECVHSLFPS